VRLTGGVDDVGRSKMPASIGNITSVFRSCIPCQVSILAELSMISYRRESVNWQLVYTLRSALGCPLADRYLPSQTSCHWRSRSQGVSGQTQSATGPAGVKGVSGQTKATTGAAEIKCVSGQTQAATGAAEVKCVSDQTKPPLERQNSNAFLVRQAATGPAKVKCVSGQTQAATGAVKV